MGYAILLQLYPSLPLSLSENLFISCKVAFTYNKTNNDPTRTDPKKLKEFGPIGCPHLVSWITSSYIMIDPFLKNELK
jgi:hypothetical protein